MKKNMASTNQRSLWVDTAAGAVRTVFGLVWAVDAYLKFRPEFLSGYLGIIQGAASGQPAWLTPWFNFWVNTISLSPDFFAWSTRIIETAIAISLLFGLGRKWMYLLSAIFSFIIWAVPEGLGGPYAPGATDIGTGIIYVLVFVALIVLDSAVGRSPYSVDYYIERAIPNWRLVAEWASPQVLAQEPAMLPWSTQIPIIIGLVIFLLVILFLITATINLAPPPSSSMIPQLMRLASLH
jgi:nitrite reductase (NO-forming)